MRKPPTGSGKRFSTRLCPEQLVGVTGPVFTIALRLQNLPQALLTTTKLKLVKFIEQVCLREGEEFCFTVGSLGKISRHSLTEFTLLLHWISIIYHQVDVERKIVVDRKVNIKHLCKPIRVAVPSCTADDCADLN